LTAEPRSDQLLGKLTAAFGGQIGIFLFGFGSQVLLARALGPEGKGAFSLVVLVVVTVSMVVHGSLGAANAHFIGRYPAYRPAIVGNSFVWALGFGGLVLLLFLTVADRVLPEIFPNIDPSLVKKTVPVLPLLMLLEYSSLIVMGQNRIVRYSSIVTSREFLFLFGLAVSTAFGVLTPRGALVLWMTAAGLMALFSAWSAWSGGDYKLKLDAKVWAATARYSAQAHIANLSGFLKMRADMLIMGYYLTVAEIGYYSVAFAILQGLWYLPTSVAQVLIPHISWRGDGVGDAVTPRLCRITFFLNLVIGLLIGLFGKIGIKLVFGADFLPAYPALLIILPGAVLFSLAKLLSGYLGGKGLPKYSMVISVIVLTLNVAVNLVLIPAWRIRGAALTASITHSIAGAMFLWAFKRESGVSLRESLVIRADDFRLLRVALFKTRTVK